MASLVALALLCGLPLTALLAQPDSAQPPSLRCLVCDNERDCRRPRREQCEPGLHCATFWTTATSESGVPGYKMVVMRKECHPPDENVVDCAVVPLMERQKIDCETYCLCGTPLCNAEDAKAVHCTSYIFKTVSSEETQLDPILSYPNNVQY